MFNNRLKDLRLSKQLTQDKLANEISLTRSTIAAYEQGSISPSVDTLLILSSYFEVSIDYLLGLTDETNNQNKCYEKLINYYSRLNQENQDIALGQIALLLKEQQSTNTNQTKNI